MPSRERERLNTQKNPDIVGLDGRPLSIYLASWLSGNSLSATGQPHDMGPSNKKIPSIATFSSHQSRDGSQVRSDETIGSQQRVQQAENSGRDDCGH